MWVFVDKSEQGRLAVVATCERERKSESAVWECTRERAGGCLTRERAGSTSLSFPSCHSILSSSSSGSVSASWVWELDKRYHSSVEKCTTIQICTPSVNRLLKSLTHTHTYTVCMQGQRGCSATKHLSTKMHSMTNRAWAGSARAKWLIHLLLASFEMSHCIIFLVSLSLLCVIDNKQHESIYDAN